ncbi:MAG TPA: heme ABC exporter ATP-binding protein CcmA [Nitrospinota bacterium]|nr:heme ABC exporter ATP-binding protein CcmA [Nitrospinota bacterium]|tara:strand:- start:162170 stop:162898 length:729 start_codon:yes stop_codon:yes gene_type:complete
MNKNNFPVIQLDAVSKKFGSFSAVDTVDLSLYRGEFLTIFGPNGAGKTTLLKIMAGLIKATSGKVLINGLEFENDYDELRRNIGFISHQSFVYGQLSALQNLVFFAELYGITPPKERAMELLRDVGLESRKDEPVRIFSRGMLQRLSIARALVQNPDIIYLDEPYTGLDQHAAEMLKNQLLKMQNENRTIVMITHNLKIGIGMGSRVALQVSGRIHLDMSTKDFNYDTFNELYQQIVDREHY